MQQSRVKNPSIINLSHVNSVPLVFMPLPLLTFITTRIFQLGLRAKKTKLKASVKFVCRKKREGGRESEVGLFLVQIFILAQGFSCCSKAREHTSETPSFMTL